MGFRRLGYGSRYMNDLVAVHRLLGQHRENGRAHVSAARLRRAPSTSSASPPRRPKGGTCERPPMTVRLLTVLAAVSGHFGEPVAEISAPFGIAAAGEVKPRRSHCVRATHVDHPAFLTSPSIRQRYIATGRATREVMRDYDIAFMAKQHRHLDGTLPPSNRRPGHDRHLMTKDSTLRTGSQDGRNQPDDAAAPQHADCQNLSTKDGAEILKSRRRGSQTAAYRLTYGLKLVDRAWSSVALGRRRSTMRALHRITFQSALRYEIGYRGRCRGACGGDHDRLPGLIP